MSTSSNHVPFRVRRHVMHWLGGVTFAAMVLSILSGCASEPQATPDEEEEWDGWKTAAPKEPARPEYHGESAAVTLERDESSALKRMLCADAQEPPRCREEVGRRVVGYRGAFSGPGANELIVDFHDSVVLVSEDAGQWQVKSQVAGVDVEDCMVASQPGEAAVQHLVCRAPAQRQWGFGMDLVSLATDESGQLQIEAIAAPRATDVDTALFAGWKDADGAVEVRFHKESKLRGDTTLSFEGAESCRYRTYRYEIGAQPVWGEVDGCPGSSAKAGEDAQSGSSAYENRLEEPIRAHNRQYVTCYQRELERLESVRELRESTEEDQGEDVQEKDSEALAPKEPTGEATDKEAVADAGEESAGEPADKDAEADAEQEASSPPEPISGDVHVRFVIGSAGTPLSCQVVETSLDNQNVEQCLCREVMKTSFAPVPSGKFVDVTYPFSFSP